MRRIMLITLLIILFLILFHYAVRKEYNNIEDYRGYTVLDKQATDDIYMLAIKVDTPTHSGFIGREYEIIMPCAIVSKAEFDKYNIGDTIK